MKLFYTLVVIGIMVHDLKAQGIITDLISSGGTIIEGLAKEVPNILPTPAELFHLPVQVLFGLPETALVSVINELCKFLF